MDPKYNRQQGDTVNYDDDGDNDDDDNDDDDDTMMMMMNMMMYIPKTYLLYDYKN